jgi:hypothetical protein
MDPDTMYSLLLHALDNCEYDDAIEHADKLLAWMDRGGREPRALLFTREESRDRISDLRATAVYLGSLPVDDES